MIDDTGSYIATDTVYTTLTLRSNGISVSQRQIGNFIMKFPNFACGIFATRED